MRPLCPSAKNDSGGGVPLTKGSTSMVQRFVRGLSSESLFCEFRLRCRIVVLAGKQRTSAWLHTRVEQVDAFGLHFVVQRRRAAATYELKPLG